jgi:hypothetical protein
MEAVRFHEQEFFDATNWMFPIRAMTVPGLYKDGVMGLSHFWGPLQLSSAKRNDRPRRPFL